jgi:site-specific recombinase XerD
MEVVYLYYESGSIRVPYFGFISQFYSLFTHECGGIWNNEFRGFLFAKRITLQRLCSMIVDVPCVVVDETAAEPVKLSGFLERTWEHFSGMLCDCQNPTADIVRHQSPPEIPQRETDYQQLTEYSGKASSGENSSVKSTDAIFLIEPPPAPELFAGQWCFLLEMELRARKYSIRTMRLYLYFNQLLCRTVKKRPEEIATEDITCFLANVEKTRDYSASSINLAISAIRFFYREVFKNGVVIEPHRPRHDKRLPVILSKEEIVNVLRLERNPKHRLLLMLVYSSGLRVSEVVALKKEHVDLARKVIYVRLGKGRKDRCTLLSEKAAAFLVEYYTLYDIETWLFPGQPPNRHLSIRSAQHIFDKAVRHAAIPKDISIHGLRHTFATHLLESGTDIRYIQSLLGHTTLRTTERYTHVARRSVLNIKSPLDTIL